MICYRYMLIFILPFIALVHAGLNLQCNDNMVYYWGQNSYGGAHLNDPGLWEKDLAAYCDDGNDANVINISFLNTFNAGTGALPEVNFANHCKDFFTGDPSAAKVRNCTKIGQDIEYCQSKGKTILLSLGGAIANTGFPSAGAAQEFSKNLWDMFMEGSHKFRPFGDAIVDGIDLDLEGGSQDHYGVFLGSLQTLYKTSRLNRRYYVTAAPQCEFPDRNLQTIMETGHMDAIFIQFYNNWCGVQNYNNPNAWNWPTWSTWAKTKSYNKDVKLFLGVPASRTAAGNGYVSVDALKKIIGDLRTSQYSSNFGGVMMWDLSQVSYNLVGNKNYGKVIKEFLTTGRTCNGSPAPAPTTTSTATSSAYPTSSTTSFSTTANTSVTSTETQSHSTPQPTSKCPVSGEACNQANSCSGTHFAVCNFGKWIVYPCSSGSVCSIDLNGSAYCGYPGSNTPPPCH